MGKRRSMATLSLAIALSAFIATGVSSALAQANHEHAHNMEHMGQAKEVTLKGEVLDLYCYMKHPMDGQGPDHAKCAKMCMSKGLPIGFLSDGTVYLLLGKEHEPIANDVMDFAGKQSVLTGTLIEHDGVKSIEFIKIEPAKDDKGS
jgi:hypothetical protein